MTVNRRLLLLAAWLSTFGCAKSQVQQTGYAGNGRYEGQPPMCFQIQKETRPSASSQNHLLAHFNNTCRHAVACDVTNTENDQVQQVNVPAMQNRSLLIALSSEQRNFDIDVDCSWTP